MAPRAPRIDLHAHSSFSDGRLAPDELVRRAVRRDVRALALTDHDSTEGVPAFLEAARREGVDPVPGVEISCESDGERAHILSLFVDPKSPARAVLVERRKARALRLVRIVEKLSALGLAVHPDELSHADGGSPGRPHIARLLVAKRYVRSVAEAFARYLGDDGPAYVPKARVPVAEGIRLARDLGGIPILAHPGADKLLERLDSFVERGIEGVEAYHPKHGGETTARLLRYAKDRGLAVSGGSDFHAPDETTDLGLPAVPAEVLDALKERHARVMRRRAAGIE